MKRLAAILALFLAVSVPMARGETLEEARIRIAMAMARARAVSERRTDAPPLEAPAFRWDALTPGQLSLRDGAGRFVGAWRQADGVYLEYPGWAPAELPCALPEGAQSRPFPLDSKTTTDAAVAGETFGTKPAPARSLDRTGMYAKPATFSFGIGTSNRLCVGRT